MNIDNGPQLPEWGKWLMFFVAVTITPTTFCMIRLYYRIKHRRKNHDPRNLDQTR